MARSGGKPAAEVDFSNREQVAAWFRRQTGEVCIAFAARSALRVLPLIDAVRTRSRPDFAARVALPVLRACFVTWAIGRYPSRGDRWLGAARSVRNSIFSVRAYAAVADNAITAAAHAIAANTDGPHAAPTHAAYATAAAARAADAALLGTSAFVGTAAIERAIQVDADVIEQGRTVAEIIAAPLWPGKIPERITAAWDDLRTWMLTEDDANIWDPWVQWFERVGDGRPSFGEAFDLAVASLTDEQWNEEPVPAAVNRRIAALLAEHTPTELFSSTYVNEGRFFGALIEQTSPEPIPPQGPGPHVVLNAAGKLDQAPPEDIDADGNNLARIRQLLPVQRGAVADLLAHLSSTDAFSQLASVVRDYRDAIAGDETRIAWGTVFGLGVRLDNAAAAAKRQIDDRLAPSLEDAALEALDTAIRLHGPLILATREGRELSDEADSFELSREQLAALRRDAEAIVEGLKKAREIVEPSVVRIVEGAAETVGEGRRPERGAAYWTGVARNLATVLVPASALAALAWLVGGVGGEPIKIASGLLLRENPRIREAARALSAEYNRLVDAAFSTTADQADLVRAQAIARLRVLTPFRDFVIANEAPLRRIAAYSPNLRWMLWYIDFVLRTNGKR